MKAPTYHTKNFRFFNAKGSGESLKTFKSGSDVQITVISVKNGLKIGKAGSREGN